MKMKRKEKRTRSAAQELLIGAQKVYHYRRDVLEAHEVSKLERLKEALENKVEDKHVPADTLESCMAPLEEHLKKIGGTFFPKKFWPDNVEVFLVAAILAIGIRFFFLHPFAIPTNSMYPTYSGMQPRIYTQADPRPAFPVQLFERLLNWRGVYKVQAPAAGALEIPVFEPNDPRGGYGLIRYEMVRRFTPLPSLERHYRLYIGGEPVDLYLPRDFSLDDVLYKALLSKHASNFVDFYRNQIVSQEYTLMGRELRLNTPLHFETKETLLDFDVLTGDVLFVDRMSYHFVKPKLGDPIVFRTDTIPTLRERPAEYFIKRLVGLPGDTLEVRSPILYRNGQPIEGNAAFQANAQKAPGFRGYSERGRLDRGLKEHLPEDHYYGMGDNSYESGDSRSFGPLPKKAFVGRAFFIYYPFTKRWGPAR